MKASFWKILGLTVILSMLFTLSGTAWAAQPLPQESEDWWAKAAEPYKGVTIKGISESTPPSKYAAEVLAPAFEEATGIKVEFETTSWDLQYTKAIQDMEAGTGVYDFVYVEQDIVYAYLDRKFLVNLTQMMAEKPELIWPGFNVNAFTSFIDYFKDPATGDVYGIPIEAFIKIYLYRKDLFEDPEVKAAFEKEYGYPLAPAVNHKQYADIAAFFAKWGKDHNMELWGTTVQANTGHPASFYELFETILPSFGVYNWGINLENWKATVANGGTLNSDRAKEAFAFWVDLLKYAPPEATASTWDEVAASFAAGRAAQGWVYGENAAWIATDESRSKVVGKVGAALPPLYAGVLEDKILRNIGYIGYYDGGAYGIPHSSKNKEAALLWLQWLSRPDIQVDWAMASARVTQTATFDDPRLKEFDKKVDGYFTMLKEKGFLFGGAPPFPFHATIREVIAPFIYKGISGEMGTADALDQAAAAVDQELVRLGYGK